MCWSTWEERLRMEEAEERRKEDEARRAEEEAEKRAAELLANKDKEREPVRT